MRLNAVQLPSTYNAIGFLIVMGMTSFWKTRESCKNKGPRRVPFEILRPLREILKVCQLSAEWGSS